MDLQDFQRQARELEHSLGHHQRTIVCHPNEKLAIQASIVKLMEEPDYADKPVPLVSSSRNVEEGHAYITCGECLAARLTESIDL